MSNPIVRRQTAALADNALEVVDCKIDGIGASFVRISADTSAAHEFVVNGLAAELPTDDLVILMTAGSDFTVDLSHLFNRATLRRADNGRVVHPEQFRIVSLQLKAKAATTTFTVTATL